MLVIKLRTLNDKGDETTMQKRHLVMSVREAYSIWKADNPNMIAGKSKFASLRPKNVLLTSKLPRNVCVCKHHEKFHPTDGCTPPL